MEMPSTIGRNTRSSLALLIRANTSGARNPRPISRWQPNFVTARVIDARRESASAKAALDKEAKAQGRPAANLAQWIIVEWLRSKGLMKSP
jgi:hypothetical protein